MKKFGYLVLFTWMFSMYGKAQSITSVAPLKGPAGTLVTITGSGFSSTASENIVFFGQSKGNVASVNSAGTMMTVNSPINPSHPFRVSVLNTNTGKYIESRFEFHTSFAARINPETRDIDEQFQTYIRPDQSGNFNADYLDLQLRQPQPYTMGSEALIAGDINNDGSLDFLNQYTTPYVSASGLEKKPLYAFVNQNPLFALTSPINSSSATANNGFTKYEGNDKWSTTPSSVGLDLPDVIIAGYLFADLNNDGKADLVNYGTYGKGVPQPGFEVLVNSSTSSIGFYNDAQNKFIVTASGGQDYYAANGYSWTTYTFCCYDPDGNPQYSTQQQTIYGYVSNTYGTVSPSNQPFEKILAANDEDLKELILTRAKAMDLNSDGKKDLIFLLSSPKNSTKGNGPAVRQQLIVLLNTTSKGSNQITFTQSQVYPAISNAPSSAGGYAGVDYWLGLSGTTASPIDYITDFDLGDINNDGKVDIVFKGINNRTIQDSSITGLMDGTSYNPQTGGSSGTGFVYYALNQTTSSLSFATPVALNASISLGDIEDWGGISLGDLDIDGDLDIIVSTPKGITHTTSPSLWETRSDITLFRNDGSLTFNESTITGQVGTRAPTTANSNAQYPGILSNMKVADLNGDGLPDIMVTSSNRGNLEAYMQRQSTASNALTSGSFIFREFDIPNISPNPQPANPISIAIADFSNDGKLDLVVLQYVSGQASVVYLKNDDGLPQIYSSVQLSDFVKCTGQTSAGQTFKIGGETISRADGRYILVTAPTGFEVSRDGGTTYKDTVHYRPDSNNEVMPAKTVHIRMKASANNSTYSGDLEISTFNAATVAIELKGSLDVPSYSAISPSTQYVNTTNSNTQNGSTIPTPSPAATSSPVAVELADVNGTVQWQKSTDNSTWSDITGATSTSYTLPDADLNNQGIVYLRAQITVCSSTSTTDVVTILENLGIPAPPNFSASNGQTLSGTFDESLATTLTIYNNSGSPVSTCSDLTGSTCSSSGWSFNNGTYTYIPTSQYSDGDQFYAVASNTSGASQNSNTITVDATAPLAPAIAANSDGSSVRGTAEAGSTVTLSLNNGGTTTTVDVIVSANGTWEYVPVPTLAHGVTITATATDAVGNISSSSAAVTVDAQAPTNTATYTNASGDALSDGTTVEGTTEPGATVTVTMPNGDVYTTTADATTGAYSVTVSGTSTSDGDELTVSIEDVAGNTMPSETVTVDKTAPAANIYATDGISFNGALDGTGYSVTISYGSGPTTQSATVTGSTFNWTPSPALGLSVGDQITYTITDEVGNETTYTTTVQAVAHCIPQTASGIELSSLTFDPNTTNGSSVSFTEYISDEFNDRSTDATNTIELEHDALPTIYFSVGAPLTAYLSVWIDLNQNGTFESSEEQTQSTSAQMSSSTSSAPFTWTSAPFEDETDGNEYIMRIGISTGAALSDPCGSSSVTANFQDLRIKVLNCEDPASLTVAQASNGSAQLEVDFVLEEASMDITYVIAKAQSAFDDPLGTDPNTWISSNSATATTTNMTGVSNGTNYDYSFSATTDSEGNSLTLGSYYSVAIKKSCASSNWVKYQDQQGFSTVELIDPNGPDYSGSDFAITSHTYTQSFSQTQQPSNTLNLPVGESLSVKTTVKGSDGSTAVVPSVFNYFDVVDFFNYDPSSGGAPTFILGTINTSIATQASLTALSVTNTNEVTYSTTPTSATSYWLTYTFKELAQGAQPLDAYWSGFANSVNVAWYEAPVLNSNGDGLTGAVPGETVTLVLDGTTYTATAGNDGTVALTSFTYGSNTLSSDAISALVNGSYSINQSWSAGGISYSHTSPTQVLSALSINAGANSVSGTAAPGATVTLTIGDKTFTTTADATTGIYDFAGTTSSTGVTFNTLVPFTATTAYTINQSLTGYTSGPAVTGSIIAPISSIVVPTITNALALSNTSYTTLSGIAEAGAMVYLYNKDGKQLFNANGDPITTTANNQGAYSITVDLSAAKISNGSNSFTSVYFSPYDGSVIQVGSTGADGNTTPLSAAFVNPSVYTSSGAWTNASGTSISAPSTSVAATNSSPVIRYEKTTSLSSGLTGLKGLEIASGVIVTVPSDGCLDVLGSIAAQGTGALKLESASTNGSVQSAQLKFGGEYLGPPTVEMSGQLASVHTIGSPMKEGLVPKATSAGVVGDADKLFAWNANTGTYYYDNTNSTYSGAAPTTTQGLGYFAGVGSGQFLSQPGEFRVVGSPISSLTFDLGYAADVFSSTSAGSGWNLIANPFTCGWDFSDASFTNVNQSFYVKNTGTSANGGYSYWATSGSTLSSSVVPPMQGFWVQTTGPGAASIVTDMSSGGKLCSTSQNTFFKTQARQVKISLEDVQTNLSYPIFLTDILGAQKGFDGSTDAWFLGNGSGAPEWCFKIGEEKVAANGVEYPDSLSMDIHFAHSVIGKKFRILTDTTGLSSDWEVVLLDRFTGTRYNLLQDAPVVSYSISPVDFSGTRFKLFMRDRTKVSELNDIIGYEDLGGLYLSFNSGTLSVEIPEFENQYFTYELTDLVGRVVRAGNIPNNGKIPIDESLPNGTYVVRLMGQKVKIERMVISR